MTATLATDGLIQVALQRRAGIVAAMRKQNVPFSEIRSAAVRGLDDACKWVDDGKLTRAEYTLTCIENRLIELAVHNNQGLIGVVFRSRQTLLDVMRRTGVSSDDIEAEAQYGLYLAASSTTYDPKQSAFSTYATRMIGWQLSRFLSMWAGYEGSARRFATLGRASITTGIGRGKESFTHRSSETHALQAETLTDPAASDEPQVDDAQATADVVECALASLTERERFVIERRFGINGRDVETLTDIGKSLGIGKERTRQIESAALKLLRARMMAVGLASPFMEDV